MFLHKLRCDPGPPQIAEPCERSNTKIEDALVLLGAVSSKNSTTHCDCLNDAFFQSLFSGLSTAISASQSYYSFLLTYSYSTYRVHQLHSLTRARSITPWHRPLAVYPTPSNLQRHLYSMILFTQRALRLLRHVSNASNCGRIAQTPRSRAKSRSAVTWPNAEPPYVHGAIKIYLFTGMSGTGTSKDVLSR
jgi:hypothetical protein